MTTKIAYPRPCVKCGSPSYAYELEKIDQGYRAYWACSREFCFGRFYTTELSTSLVSITKEEFAKLQPNPAKGIATIEEN